MRRARLNICIMLEMGESRWAAKMQRFLALVGSLGDCGLFDPDKVSIIAVIHRAVNASFISLLGNLIFCT